MLVFSIFSRKKIASKCMLIMLIFPFLTGCINDPEIISFTDLKFHSVEDAQVNVEFGSLIYNDNAFPIKINKSQFSFIYLKDTIGHLDINKETKLTGSDSTLLLWQAGIFLPVAEKNYPKVLKADSVNFELIGKAKYRVLGIPLNRKIDENINVDLRKVLVNAIQSKLSNSGGLSFEKINFAKTSNSNFTLKAVASIDNNLDINYKIENINLGLSFDKKEQEFASYKLEEAVEIIGMNQIKIPIQIEINRNELMKNVNIFELSSGSLELFFTGSVEVSLDGYHYDVPFDFKKEITLGSML